MQYKLKTLPIIYPITLDEAKAQINAIGSTYDDALISSLIAAACNLTEAYAWRPLVEQTWELYLDSAEVTDTIYLNKTPLKSVASVKYYNADNTLTTLDTSLYSVDLVSDTGRIKFNSTPSVYEGMNKMVIEFTCGFLQFSDAVVADSVSHAADTITKTAHGLYTGQPLIITAVQNLTNVSANKLYYVSVVDANTFQLTNEPYGTHINFSGADVPAITYKSASAIPDQVKSAILLIVGHLYKHREDVTVGASGAQLPMGSQYLLDFYKQKNYYI